MSKLSNRTREILAGLIFVSPWIIGFSIFGVYPIVYSLFLSFNNVEIYGDSIKTAFVGFGNYQQALTNDAMIKALMAFFKDSLFMVFVINVFAVLFAVILNGSIKGRGIFRTIFFLPVIVVSGPVMEQLVSKNVITMPNIGSFQIINILGATFGETLKNFIVTTFSDLIYMFWFSGVQLIVYLTMLQKMDKSMYEAAEMDGASVWESFWKITLPALKPAILINIVYTIILLATFDDNGVIQVIAQQRDASIYGMATAMAWIYFIVLAIIVIAVVLLLYGKFGNKEKRYVAGEAYVYNQTRYQAKTGFLYTNRKVKKIKKIILGKNFSDGILAKVFVYTVLGVVSFAFLYPFFYMLLKSLQSADDVINPAIGLLPSKLYGGNFGKAINTLGLWPSFAINEITGAKELKLGSLLTSIVYSGVPALCQVVSCALVGYGLAKFKFPGKKLVFACVIISFIIPPQILMIPTFRMYNSMKLTNTIFVFALPALLAQGLKNTIFIMLYYQFFAMLPRELDEAAEVDGASKFKIFMKVAIPLSGPIFIVSFVFSFVWYWNETYLTTLYMPEVRTLPLQLDDFAKLFQQPGSGNGAQTGGGLNSYENKLNDAVFMAGTLISIIPLLIVYFILQKRFVEGIDKAGLTGQ